MNDGKQNYWLIFVKSKEDNEWGFYGFHWFEKEVQEREQFLKDNFLAHKIVKGEVGL